MCVRGISREFQECFKDESYKFQGGFKRAGFPIHFLVRGEMVPP